MDAIQETQVTLLEEKLFDFCLLKNSQEKTDLDSMEEIKFSTKPYDVSFKDYHSNKVIHVKRRPPEKLHDMLPTDKVELKFKKNDDWPAGDYEVRHINYRAPNTIQIEDSKGATTFVASQDLELIKKNAHRGNEGSGQGSSEIDNDYLGWP